MNAPLKSLPVLPGRPGLVSLILLLAALGTAFACEQEKSADPATGTSDPTHPAASVTSEAHPAGETRSFAMGFGVNPPRPEVQSVLDLVPRMAEVGEYAIIQRPVPWKQLLGQGQSVDEVIESDWRELVAYIRNNGLGLVVLVDPLDGLNRRVEPPELTDLGRSLAEPDIMELHESWVMALAEQFQPEYLGLASEINTPAAHGSEDLYALIRDMTNRLAPQVREASPNSKTFVSFQVDDAWGHFPFTPSNVDQFALASEFDVDVIGLSSYPVFYFDSPSEIPNDYYQRFLDAAGGRPLGQFEGGWTSLPLANGRPGSPELEAEWVRRVGDLLQGVDAEIWLHLTFADLDLSDPRWGLPPERAQILDFFASMGLVDSDFEPKPAYEEWRGLFERERE